MAKTTAKDNLSRIANAVASNNMQFLKLPSLS